MTVLESGSMLWEQGSFDKMQRRFSTPVFIRGERIDGASTSTHHPSGLHDGLAYTLAAANDGTLEPLNPADHIAPNRSRYSRTLVVETYPDDVSGGWLEGHLADALDDCFEVAVTVTYHVVKRDTREIPPQLRDSIFTLEETDVDADAAEKLSQREGEVVDCLTGIAIEGKDESEVVNVAQAVKSATEHTNAIVRPVAYSDRSIPDIHTEQ